MKKPTQNLSAFINAFYNNVGESIKNFAKFVFAMGGLLALYFGIMLLTRESFLAGILLILTGPLFALMLSYPLYGFGMIIDKVCTIEQNSSTICTLVSIYSPNTPSTATSSVREMSTEKPSSPKNPAEEMTPEQKKTSDQLLQKLENMKKYW